MDMETKMAELERRIAELEKERPAAANDHRVLIPLIHREVVVAMQGHKARRG
jgi:hypothetical protein